MTFRCFFSVLLISIFFNFPLFSGDVQLSVQLDRKENFVGQPLSGIFNVQHNREDIVDTNSVLLGKESLKVEFVRDVTIDTNSPLVVSFYKFQLPPQEAGTNVLPAISVKVGDEIYKTQPLTYEVQAPIKTIPPESNSQKTYTPYLKLESFIEGKVPLYIGQKIRVGYRLFFNDTYDLDEIVLPLIEAKGFKKIGKERVNEFTETRITVRQIDQEIEALSTGDFIFGPSYIVGAIYGTNVRGKKQLIYNNIKAETPAVTITVLDFPKQGKPTSFNGSVGEEISFQVELKTTSSLNVGDKLTLQLQFTSKNDISNIKLPNLCCQPGFPGMFQVDDIPPVGKNQRNILIFSVGMRALSTQATSIPSIEFSYFNPKTERYEIKKSKQIPIVVSSRPQNKSESKKQEQQQDSEQIVWPEVSNQTKPIEIKTIYPIDGWDLQNRYFGTWKVFMVVPFAVFAMILQFYLLEYKKKWMRMNEAKKSQKYLKKAKIENISSSEFYLYLNLALISSLKEAGIILDKDYSPQDLPKDGISGEIKNFLTYLEEQRFSGKETYDRKELIFEAENFLNRIQGKI